MKLSFILVFAAVCLLAACALEPKRNEPPVTRVIMQPAHPSESDELLGYLAQARKLDTRQFVAERELMRNTFQADKSEFNRVKLALLLAAIPGPAGPVSAGANAGEDGDLIALLEPLVHNAGASPAAVPPAILQTGIRPLAMLVYGMAQDRKKLREQWRDAQARVNAMRRDDTKDVEARTLRARVEELEGRLAALKSIDRSVNRRSETQRIESPVGEPPK